jgi:DNA-binding response OmpR family regulator
MPDATCPCCGGRISGTDLKTLLTAIRWTKTETRIIETLVGHPTRTFTRAQLADAVYADHADGGPDSAENVLSVLVGRIRKKLTGTGWTVTGRHGVHGCYRIARA